jgi:hypothetical protein
MSALVRRALIGGRDCACELNSGERMLAGGEYVAGGCTPAKPSWPEVIVFWKVFLRRGNFHRRREPIEILLKQQSFSDESRILSLNASTPL